MKTTVYENEAHGTKRTSFLAVSLLGAATLALGAGGCGTSSTGSDGGGGSDSSSPKKADATPGPGFDGGPNRRDATESCETSGCASDKICCPADEVCRGQCVPDCRTQGCPTMRPNCEQATGICSGDATDGGRPPKLDGSLPRLDGALPRLDGALREIDGSLPQFDGALPELDGSLPINLDGSFGDGGRLTSCGDGGACAANKICCPTGEPCQGQCVPDCRTQGCPNARLSCDQATGLCRM